MSILRCCVLGKETLNISTSNGADDQWIRSEVGNHEFVDRTGQMHCVYGKDTKSKMRRSLGQIKKQFKVSSQMKCIKSCNSKEKRTVIR